MPLTLEQSQTLIAAAHEHAYAAGLKVTVAVVDEGGLLKALGRMDGAPPLSAQIAEAKAVGAAVWHRDGDQLASVQDARGAFFESVSRLTRLPLIPADGSVVIRDGDTVLGAVGVSGAKPEEDRECAEAGVAAVLDARQ
jgi:glc operon protein GlcG